MMSLNRYRLKHLQKNKHKGAVRAGKLLERPDRLIGLILIGNNFFTILSSSLATIIAIRLGGEGAIPIAAGLLTLLILVFSEVAPKTMAALYPEQTEAFRSGEPYTASGPLPTAMPNPLASLNLPSPASMVDAYAKCQQALQLLQKQ